MTSYGTIVATKQASLLLAGKPFANNGALVSYTVANNDETNPVWIGESRALSPTDPGAVQVAPLGSAPIDPTTTTYIITNGPNVQVFLFAGGGTWSPSPAQVATQISLLGLASAANQVTQSGLLTTGNSNTSGIETNTAGTETAVNLVNGTLGNPAQNTTTVNPNPYLFGGSSQGWSALNGAITVTSTPVAGCPAAYALNMVPSGANQFPAIEGGAFPVTALQYYMARGGVVCEFTDANVTGIKIEFLWYSDQAGTVLISGTNFVLPTPPINQWVWLNSGMPGAQAPATAVTCRISMSLIGTANVAAADVWQMAAFPVFTNLPGPPAQESTLAGIHDRIANTGVPLLRLPSQLAASGSQNLSTSILTLFNGNVNQSSYEINLTVQCATLTNITINMLWVVNNQVTPVIIEDSYAFYAGSNAGGHVVCGRGPCKGYQLFVQIIASQNVGPPVLSEFQLVQTSAIYPYDLWMSQNGPNLAVPGFTIIGTPEPQYGIVGSSGFISTGIGGTTSLLLPYFTGKCTFSAQTQSATTDGEFSIIDAGILAVNEYIDSVSNAQGYVMPVEIFLPNVQAQLAMKNNNAAAKNMRAQLIAGRY
jgi:hypothetical protein